MWRGSSKEGLHGSSQDDDIESTEIKEKWSEFLDHFFNIRINELDVLLDACKSHFREFFAFFHGLPALLRTVAAFRHSIPPGRPLQRPRDSWTTCVLASIPLAQDQGGSAQSS